MIAADLQAQLTAVQAERDSLLEEVQRLRGNLCDKDRLVGAIPAEMDSVQGPSTSFDVSITSPLCGHRPHAERAVDGTPVWSSFCPCCRRPLEIRCTGAVEPDHVEARSPSRVCAYVSLLYGEGDVVRGYALGALALGQSLSDSGTRHDAVLMHTDDVPSDTIAMLRSSGFWKMRRVEYLHGSSMLGNMVSDYGWLGIFTKLRLFSLVEYSRVIFLDLDVLVLRNMDVLFDLCPPAAMVKGLWRFEHGARLDGRTFFPDKGAWNEPHGGINAGVMLLEPDVETHLRMQAEVVDKWHPEHIYSYGPEQEYLSRFFADRWRHISPCFNFQLYRLDASRSVQKLMTRDDLASAGCRAAMRLVEDISAAQFSSGPKPWDLVRLSPLEVEARVRSSMVDIADDDGSQDLALELVQMWLAALARSIREWPHEKRCELGLPSTQLSNHAQGNGHGTHK